MRPTAILADDDALARDRFRDLLEEHPLVELVGEASDGGTALELVERHEPAVAILDIQMPVMTGLEVAARIQTPTVVIFTTAHDRYAVSAFELAAVDYLLKPFGADRFAEALERAVASVGHEGAALASDRLNAVGAEDPPERIYLRDRNGIAPVKVSEIEYGEADGDYVHIHARGRVFMVRMRLKELEKRLGDGFLRIHRSIVVNLNEVEAFENHDDSRLAAVLHNGHRLVVSRAVSIELRRRST
ncbi:MAG: LytTR family DNA-binding domain-containing protein [Longimicrobiales bacterium]|nr:LytTR family DNA-binding domain-containing protein [Longimicrobiales bacterium]